MGAPVIDEIRFPVENLTPGVTGGAGFSTLIIVDPNSQAEQRQANWDQPRYSWDAGVDAMDPDVARIIVAFFMVRRGRARGFRWKDWQDFQATDEPLNPTGTPMVQLIKTYTDAIALSYARNIYKIGRVSDGCPLPTFELNGDPLTPDCIDYNTGQILLPIINQRSIVDISQAASAVVDVGASHGFAVDDLVYFIDVEGMTEINGLVGKVTGTGGSTITVDIDSTDFTAYDTGGTATKYLEFGDQITWSGEFDVPVRFDTDQLRLVQEDVLVRSWGGIPIVEIRQGTLEPDCDPFAPSELEAEASL